MYTSGSTGRPKGVLLTHAGQGFTFEKYVAAGIVPDGSSTLIAAPLYHKNAAVSMKVTLGSRATAVMMPRFEPRAYLQALVEYGCATVIGVPTMFALMLNERDLIEELDLGHVTRMVIGSAPMTEALQDDVRAAFPNAAMTNSYGTTEVIAIFGEHPDGLPRPGISVGYPLPFVEVRLSDEGELWVRSPGAMSGYHGLPEVTAQRLVDGWYRTGDTFRVDANGFFHFVGRVDDMFVCGGENVYPGEVESMLERHPAVHQACVVPVSDRIKGQLPVAFVVATAGEAISTDEVKGFALEHGPAYAHPRHVVLVDELPLAGTAKIDRRRLVDEAEARFGDD
jgi:acyl-CoA synthetase (AMP-forming)/AMP-acid ligase II